MAPVPPSFASNSGGRSESSLSCRESRTTKYALCRTALPAQASVSVPVPPPEVNATVWLWPAAVHAAKVAVETSDQEVPLFDACSVIDFGLFAYEASLRATQRTSAIETALFSACPA